MQDLSTRLGRAIAARERHTQHRVKFQPFGAAYRIWVQWLVWANARRDYINDEISAARAEKRTNRKRSKVTS